MSSPVEVLLSKFVKIDRRKRDPIYLQIVYQLINTIRNGFLESGDQLPGSRKIAKDLGLHRKTIIAALEELRMQGWVKMEPGVGTFIRYPDPGQKYTTFSKRRVKPPEIANFRFKRNYVLDQPKSMREVNLFFTDGTPDYRLIDAKELVRFYSAVLKRRKTFYDLSTEDKDSTFFGKQLSYYLNSTRGFHLSKDFLVMVKAREQIYFILSQLLVRPGTLGLVGELSYFLPNMIFGQAGARLRTVPMDEEGLKVDFIRENFKKGEIGFIYLNTRNQYPTTVSMSDERKKSLLDLAEEYEFIILEDDVDFEFSFVTPRAISLFELDFGSRVVYLGSFGRFLTPGFQAYFMVGPEDFIQEGKKYLHLFGGALPLMERALGEMISEGDIHRYRRKVHRVLGERRTYFSELLRCYFEEDILFDTPSSGLGFWVQFRKSIALTDLQFEAKKLGLYIPRNCLFQSRKVTGLRLSYGHFKKAEMKVAIEILNQVYQEICE